MSITDELASMPEEWIGDDLRRSAYAHDDAQARRHRLEQRIDVIVERLNDAHEATLEADLETGAPLAAARSSLESLRVPALAGVDDAVAAARRELVGAAAGIFLVEPTHRIRLREWVRHLSERGLRTAPTDAAQIVGAPSAAEQVAAAEFDDLTVTVRSLRGLEEEFERAAGWHALTMARGLRANVEEVRARAAAYMAHLQEAERGRIYPGVPGAAVAVG